MEGDERMNKILLEIAKLANEVGPKEGQYRPKYDDLERFLETVSDLIPMEIWEAAEGKVCSLCDGKGTTIVVDWHGDTYLDDCSCVVKHEQDMIEQYENEKYYKEIDEEIKKRQEAGI